MADRSVTHGQSQAAPSKRGRRRRLMTVGGIALLLLCLPFAAWTFYRPVRLLAPALAGLSCVDDVVCTDDPARGEEALALYDDAARFVAGRLGPFESRPHVVFCAFAACARSFGVRGAAGKTFGPLGTVLAPRGWEPFYVRHELIHELQNQRLGAIRVLRDPRWLIEGMAYSVSDDPRHPLAQPFEQYRARFEAWSRSIPNDELWAKARAIR